MPFGDDTFTALKVYPHLFLHPVRIRFLPVSLPSKHIAHSQRSIYAVPIESSPGGWGLAWQGVEGWGGGGEGRSRASASLTLRYLRWRGGGSRIVWLGGREAWL